MCVSPSLSLSLCFWALLALVGPTLPIPGAQFVYLDRQGLKTSQIDCWASSRKQNRVFSWVFPHISWDKYRKIYDFHSFSVVSIPIAMESTRMAWHWRSPAIPLVEVWRNSVEALRGSLPNVAACGKHPLFQQEDRGNRKCNIAFWENLGTGFYHIKHADFQDGWLLGLSPVMMIFSWHVMGISRDTTNTSWYLGLGPMWWLLWGKFRKFQSPQCLIEMRYTPFIDVIVVRESDDWPVHLRVPYFQADSDISSYHLSSSHHCLHS